MQPHLQTPLKLQKSPSNIDPDSNSASFDDIKHSHIKTTTVLALHESQCGINTGSVSASVQPNLHAATTSTALQGVQSVIDPNTNSSVVYNLKQLQATVPPPALYKCPHCPYKSSYRTNVTTHLRKHTGERPYTCFYCDYNSSYKSNMNRHIQRHFTEN
ncbi:hypothetical protein Pmani_003344 [Petrolisthes manimaculis]|uniref:C2H2-type domain-containing protein n=1 Tax=Petrolisthes manimaculis TaxID=1843537 RepID=A0AAE1UQ29_9EUCA|nr:hypothetical protein Pmani_003344 [Petrolisthes manimaculis]